MRDRFHHLFLLRPHLELRYHARQRPVRREIARQFGHIDFFARIFDKGFDHDVNARRGVIDDVHAVSVKAVDACELDVRFRRGDVAGRVVVYDDLALLEPLENRGDRPFMPPRQYANGNDNPFGIECPAEKDLASARLVNRTGHCQSGVRRYPLRGQLSKAFGYMGGIGHTPCIVPRGECRTKHERMTRTTVIVVHLWLSDFSLLFLVPVLVLVLVLVLVIVIATSNGAPQSV